jgi:hypothetical protein
MRWHFRLIPLAGVLIFVANTFSTAQEKKSPNFYPLDVGNTWVFKVNANGKDAQITTQIADDEKKDDATIARLTSPNVKLTEHLTQNDKGVFRVRFNNAKVTPPFCLLPYPLKKPDGKWAEWSGKFTIEGEKGEHTYDGKIEGEEDVKVPFGVFKKALKVRIKLKEGGQDIDTVYWFVDNVGFVKQTFTVGGSTVLLELERFEDGKKKK